MNNKKAMDDYNPQLIEHRFNDIKASLDRIELQTTEHNHRLTKIERTMLIVGTATFVLLIVNGSKFVEFLMSIT